MKLMHDPIDGRLGVYKWSARISDIEGCQEFDSPERICYTKDVMSVDAPILAIVDHMREQHYVAQYKVVKHWRRGGKLFDARALPSKRSYLQCCLVQGSLFDKGVDNFSSGLCDGYYKLLLRDPSKAKHGMSARDCKLALTGVDASKIPLLTPVERSHFPLGGCSRQRRRRTCNYRIACSVKAYTCHSFT